MAYYIVCPDCGANLDPGEKCDCGGSAEQEGPAMAGIWEDGESGQYCFCLPDGSGDALAANK